MIYTWQQIAGPPVALLQNTNPSCRLTHSSLRRWPPAPLPVVLTFQLAVCNGFTCGGVASTNVTVHGSGTAPYGYVQRYSHRRSIPARSETDAHRRRYWRDSAAHFYLHPDCWPAWHSDRHGQHANFTLSRRDSAPSTLTFTVTVTDALRRSTTATPTFWWARYDHRPLNVTYSLSKSRLTGLGLGQRAGRCSAAHGDPARCERDALAAAIVLSYDPTLNDYIDPLNIW